MIALRRPTSSLLQRVRHARCAQSLPSRTFVISLITRNELKRTPLYDFHVANKARMVGFAGYSMPVSYDAVGQSTAHTHTRTSAGLFDVSHMIQQNFTGPGALSFLLSLTPSSLHTLAPHTSTLSVLLNESGGIVDDTIITKHTDTSFYVVTNAGRAKEDAECFQKHLDAWQGEKVEWEIMKGWGLVALQGPLAGEVLQRLVDVDLSGVKFGGSTFAEIRAGKGRCHIARGGYTGEDGFEVSIPPEHTVAVTELLSAQPKVMLIGLGARDSLRLEAGMCLYGHDLDESVSPVEAGLSWVIGKDRRGDDSPSFPGKSRILEELSKGPSRRRVGFEVSGAPAREGCLVYDSSGSEQIGVITSGIPSPTLGKNIAMGYIKNGSHKKGTQVLVEVRKKKRDGIVKPMPFVPTKYYK